MIYLDSASTTQPAPEVVEEMLPFLKGNFGNPGTLYGLGREAKQAVDLARERVAKFIGASPEQIIFTSGGTEANNMVFFSLREHLQKQNKTHIVTSMTEHDSVFRTVQEMCIKHGFHSSFIRPNEFGKILATEVQKEIKPNLTGIVSVMHTNNETGVINPVSDIGRLCGNNGILFHTDCVQAASSSRLNVNELYCDFLSLSSHKINGCKGVGALYVRNPELMTPIIVGGSHQEFGLRGGTENVPGIVGFGKACELANEWIDKANEKYGILKDIFYKALYKALDEDGLAEIIHVNGTEITESGKILNINFDGVDGETLLLMLDSAGICVSAGSACRSHEQEPSRVLLSMGINEEDARNSIRVSFSVKQSLSEVRFAGERMGVLICQLLI